MSELNFIGSEIASTNEDVALEDGNHLFYLAIEIDPGSNIDLPEDNLLILLGIEHRKIFVDEIQYVLPLDFVYNSISLSNILLAHPSENSDLAAVFTPQAGLIIGTSTIDQYFGSNYIELDINFDLSAQAIDLITGSTYAINQSLSINPDPSF